MVSLNMPSAVQTPMVFSEPLAATRREATNTNRRVHALPAFCVNGVRYAGRSAAHRRSSSAATAGRTARRSVGARLQPAPEAACGRALAYDPSRMRAKIQCGLRATTQPRNSARHRECKTPVACNRTVDQLGELFEAHLSIVANMFR